MGGSEGRSGGPERPGSLELATGTAEDTWQLEGATYNGSSWRGLKKFQQRTKATFVLAQEVRVKEEGLAAASQWAKQKGWK